MNQPKDGIVASEQFLSDRQVATRYNVHFLTPRRWMIAYPAFPKPVKLSHGCARWRLSDLVAWESLPESKRIASK